MTKHSMRDGTVEIPTAGHVPWPWLSCLCTHHTVGTGGWGASEKELFCFWGMLHRQLSHQLQPTNCLRNKPFCVQALTLRALIGPVALQSVRGVQICSSCVLNSTLRAPCAYSSTHCSWAPSWPHTAHASPGVLIFSHQQQHSTACPKLMTLLRAADCRGAAHRDSAAPRLPFSATERCWEAQHQLRGALSTGADIKPQSSP